MQLIEVTPQHLADWPGFDATVAALRAEVEIPEMARSSGYDVEAYTRAYDLGHLTVFAVVDATAELHGWALLIHTVTPRRPQPVYLADAMWSRSAEAGRLLITAMLRRATAAGSPLGVTAPVGGRLDASLSRSSLARKTHHYYTLTLPERR